MNKIKSLFKASPIAMAVVSLVIAGVASAAIVSYISNAPKAAVTVSAPVAMGIYEGVKDGDKTGVTSLTLTPTFGGSSMSFTTTAKNQANNRIGGYYVTVIAAEGADKITGQEFTSMMFDKNKANNPQNGEIINKLCVVKGDGNLMKLADYSAAGYSNQKLVLLLDIDGDSEQVNGDVRESTGMCSPLTPYIGNETRSFFHLDADETETWTFTPTWYVGTTGRFKISAQYVNDLAKYATEQYK